MAADGPFIAPVRLERVTPHVHASIAAAVLGIFSVSLQLRLTAYGLADIVGALGGSPDEAAWLNTAFTTAELLTIPAAGWLAVRLSARRVFVPAALAFTFFSTASVFVTRLDELIVLRALTGLTGGAFIPMATPIFRHRLPYRERLLAFALYGVAASVPMTLAPLLESLCVDHASWRLIFLPSALTSLAAAFLASWGLPREPFQRGRVWNPDWRGTLSLSMGLGFYVLAVDQANRLDWFGSNWVVGMLAAGTIAVGFCAAHEWRHLRPYYPPKLFRNRGFTIGLISFVAFTLSLIAVLWALPDFLQRVSGFRPSDFIDFFLAMILPQLVVPFLVARASDRLDLRVVLAAGLCCQAFACLRLATLNSDWAAPELVQVMGIYGLGQALFYTPVLILLTMNLEDSHRAGAVSLVNLSRVFATSLGTAMASTYLTKAEHFHHAMMNESLRTGSEAADARLAKASAFVIDRLGADEGGKLSLLLTSREMRSEAFVLAYGDLFAAIGMILLGVVLLQVLMPRFSLHELEPRQHHRKARSRRLEHRVDAEKIAIVPAE